MTKFDEIKSKNIDELAEWIDKYCWHDDAPWVGYFDKNYCSQCKCVNLDGSELFGGDYTWCEIHKKCMFFPEMEEAPDCKQVVKMWLESEV